MRFKIAFEKSPLFTDIYLIILSFDVGNIHVVGRWANVFEFFPCEDIECNHVNLSVAVFTGLRSGHLDYFARAILQFIIVALIFSLVISDY